jgi:hypothetical protein
VSALGDLFADGDYRHHLTLRRGEPREFFQSRDPTGRVLAERMRWLALEPERYAAVTAEGEPLLAEFAALCAGWGVASSATIRGLGGAMEPDFLLLSRDASSAFRLRGGALCFPTGWALEEKLGQTLDVIHGVVPGLDSALASPIHQFLNRLKPGVAFHRDNWGLAASDELNLHPARGLPAPDLPTSPERLWLRVEHQVLMALPESGGVVFGLRIALHRLDTLVADGAAAAGLRRALTSMSPEMVAYKRLDRVRQVVISWL